MNLKTDNIGDNYITFTAQKTGKSGKARIPKALARRLSANATNGFIFPGRNADKPRTRQAVYLDMKNASKAANLKRHATPHSTRKLFAVNTLNKKGFDAVMSALQHTNRDTTKLYISDNSDLTPPPWAYVIADYIVGKIAALLP